jgi:hypothetical protein
MNIVTARRHQQAVFEAAASLNRVAGSSSGSGMNIALSKAENTLLGQAVTGAAWTVITGSASAQFTLTRPTTVLVLGYILMNWSAGAQTAVISPFVDGVQVQNLAVGPAATLASPANVPICYSTLLAPGAHIIDLRVNAGNLTTYNIQSFANYVLFLN